LVISLKVAQTKQKRKTAFFVEKTLTNHLIAMKKCVSNVTRLAIKLEIVLKRMLNSVRNVTMLVITTAGVSKIMKSQIVQK
tara:strand:+ start:928 stop:1170 length:243 start_codon:yes stop_codon:yes gene_type:complete